MFYAKTQEKSLASSISNKLSADESGNIKIPNEVFGQNLGVENQKSEHHHWILYIWISLGT